MVDRIEKVGREGYRVDEARDSTDDQSGNAGTEDQGEGETDNFKKLANKTDWNVLFDKKDLWRRNVEVKVEDIDKVKLLGVNLKTNPALLKIRIFLYDSTVINTAFLAVSRDVALKFKGASSASIDINQLTKESSLWLTMPLNEADVDEEITRITATPKERTFSTTLKLLISKKTWLEKLGIQDPVSKSINREIMGVYITVVTLISAVTFAIVYLLI